MLCYISAQYALFVYKNILLFFDIKKQSHINCCRILNINLVIGICSSNSSKLQMLPTPGYVSANSYPTNCRCFHVRSSPLYVSAHPIPTSCRCFQPRPGICKSNSNKLQMLPTPGYASANPIPASCRCFRPWPGICSSQNNKSKMPTGEFSSQIRWWASLLHLYFIK